MIDLTIIIPIYNGEKFIDNCLSSLIVKAKFKLEILVINDGSTDDTSKILENYKNNKDIKIYNIDNHGVSYSRNFGIEHSSGSWITFLDIDDKFSSGWEKIFENNVLNTQEDIVICSNALDFEMLNNLNKKEIVKYLLAIKKNNYYISTPWSKFFRKSFIEKNHIRFETDLMNGEDMLFNLDAIMISKKIYFLKENIYLYNINPKSVTHKYNIKLLESDFKFHEYLNKNLNKYDCYEDSEKREILESCKSNALYLLIVNASYAKKYKDYIKEIDRLNEKKYSINKINIKSKFRNIIINLYEKRLFLLIYIILRFKKVFSRNEMAKFIEI